MIIEIEDCPEEKKTRTIVLLEFRHKCDEWVALVKDNK